MLSLSGWPKSTLDFVAVHLVVVQANDRVEKTPPRSLVGGINGVNKARVGVHPT
jgi:hypothetical protein